uniref:Uncharacterized protein n=1 Tax=Plectus sambesii TaxID=2011161 RepID=A0A914UZF6_9BILA
MLKSKNSKQPKGERRVSNFSNIPGDANGEARKGEQNVTDLMGSSFSSKYKVSGAHKAVERQGSKEVGQSKPRVEKEAVVGRSMQRKGAIADEYAHKMLASEAVVSETLRISGLRFQ